MGAQKNRPPLLAAAAVIFFDQLTKFLAPRLGLAVERNPGVAFGLWPHFDWEAVVLIFLLGLTAYLWKKSPAGSANQSLGLMLIFGGGLSNFFDRLVWGNIRDFIDLKVWPVFNLADVAITAGVLLFLAGEIKRKKGEKEDGD